MPPDAVTRTPALLTESGVELGRRAEGREATRCLQVVADCNSKRFELQSATTCRQRVASRPSARRPSSTPDSVSSAGVLVTASGGMEFLHCGWARRLDACHQAQLRQSSG